MTEERVALLLAHSDYFLNPNAGAGSRRVLRAVDTAWRAQHRETAAARLVITELVLCSQQPLRQPS